MTEQKQNLGSFMVSIEIVGLDEVKKQAKEVVKKAEELREALQRLNEAQTDLEIKVGS